jgi:glycosyltransferase involved in cell wall biosynthesis
MTAVHVVVPDTIDDPSRPSGGNTYDRRICCGLVVLGWSVHEHAVPGAWPRPEPESCATLNREIAGIPDGALVLVDGLIASTVPHVLVPQAGRLRLVVLVHMPLGSGPAGDDLAHTQDQEEAVLSAADAVVTTSRWTRSWLLDRYPLQSDRIHVAEPGVDAADLAAGTPSGGELICVAAVSPLKGHDVLLAALAMVADLEWRCTFVGDLHRDRDFADQVRRLARRAGIASRVHFTGPQPGADLDVAYAAADVLVLASRAETYGMVVTEALAHGLPVVATAVGGLPEALGRGSDGSAPGLLVPAGDPEAFAAALRRWLVDADLRQHLRRTAHERRRSLDTWTTTTARISTVLTAVAA